MESLKSHTLSKPYSPAKLQMSLACKSFQRRLHKKVILTPSELSASIVRFTLSPPTQDYFVGGTGQPLLQPASLNFSPLFPCRTLQIPCKQETSNSTEFISLVQSNPTAISQAFGLPCCPSCDCPRLTIVTLQEFTKKEKKKKILGGLCCCNRKRRKNRDVKSYFLTQMLHSVNPFSSSKLLPKFILLWTLQDNTSFTHVRVTILLFKNLHISQGFFPTCFCE